MKKSMSKDEIQKRAEQDIANAFNSGMSKTKIIKELIKVGWDNNIAIGMVERVIEPIKKERAVSARKRVFGIIDYLFATFIVVFIIDFIIGVFKTFSGGGSLLWVFVESLTKLLVAIIFYSCAKTIKYLKSRRQKAN